MSSELLKDLESAWKRTSDEVAKMESSGILPLKVKIGDTVTETITADSLKATLSQIKDSELTIAVCGVVKAGKSTFLNSIIFGRDVLPTFPTPCTAKLTFITHTDAEPHCEATFFTEDEFRRMREELKDDARARLAKEMGHAQSRGVSPAQLWGRTERVQFNSPEEMRERLRDFASEDGRYTPFVRQIKLAIDRPELKGLFIVDTPGLDDPNPLNSRETEQWAQKAHAVVYLMPWKGMSANDKAFVERNYGNLSENKDNRVFVITRIDENGDWPSTRDTFCKLFPSERNNICGYSAKIDLLFKAKESGAALSEDELWQVNKKRKEGFVPDPSDVRSLIAKRLFEGGGKNGAKFKVEQLNQQIVRCYKIFIDQSKDAAGQLEDDIRVLESEVDEAKRAVERLQKLHEKLQNDIVDIKTKAANWFSNGESAKFSLASEMKGKMKDKARHILDKHLANCNCDADILPALRRAKGEVETTIASELRSYVEAKVHDAQQALQTVQREIRIEATAAKCDELVREPDTTPFSDKGRLLLEGIDVAVDFSAVDDCIHWYRSTKANKASADAAFDDATEKTVLTMYQRTQIYEHFCRGVIDAYVSETIKNIEHGIDLRRQALASPDEKKPILNKKLNELNAIREKLRLAEKQLADV